MHFTSDLILPKIDAQKMLNNLSNVWVPLLIFISNNLIFKIRAEWQLLLFFRRKLKLKKNQIPLHIHACEDGKSRITDGQILLLRLTCTHTLSARLVHPVLMHSITQWIFLRCSYTFILFSSPAQKPQNVLDKSSHFLQRRCEQTFLNIHFGRSC